MSSTSPEPESTNSTGSDNGVGRVDPVNPAPQPPIAPPPLNVGQGPEQVDGPHQPPYGYPQQGGGIPPIPPAPGSIPGASAYPSGSHPGYGQQPGYQPIGAGYGPGMPAPYPPPKKGKKGLIIGLSIGAVVLLVCCGCIGLGIWGYQEVEKNTKENAEEIVDDFLGHLQNEDYDDAYDLLCENLRGDESSAEFAERMAEPENRIDDFSVGEASSSSRSGIDYEVEVEIARGDAVGRDEVDVVIDDDSNVKVCSQV